MKSAMILSLLLLAPALDAPDPTSMRLLDRYEVSMKFKTPTDPWQDARVTESSHQSGLFYYYNPNNFETMVKMVDGCAGGYGGNWFFASSATSIKHEITVKDTVLGVTRTYQRPDLVEGMVAIEDVEWPCT